MKLLSGSVLLKQTSWGPLMRNWDGSLANFFPWSRHRKEKVKRQHSTVSHSWGTPYIYMPWITLKEALAVLSKEICDQSKVTTLQENLDAN